jgi:hypothetical protein
MWVGEYSVRYRLTAMEPINGEGHIPAAAKCANNTVAIGPSWCTTKHPNTVRRIVVVCDTMIKSMAHGAVVYESSLKWMVVLTALVNDTAMYASGRYLVTMDSEYVRTLSGSTSRSVSRCITETECVAYVTVVGSCPIVVMFLDVAQNV